MPPELRQASDALAADPVGPAVDRPGLPSDAQRPRGPAELLEPPGVTHQVTFFLRVEHALGVVEQCTVHPRRYGGAEIDVQLDGDPLVALEGAADLGHGGRRPRLTAHTQAQVAEGLDELEGERPCAQHVGATVIEKGSWTPARYTL